MYLHTYNIDAFTMNRQELKKRITNWQPGHAKVKEALGFLDAVIIKCDEYLSNLMT